MSALSPLQLNQLVFTDVRVTAQHLSHEEMHASLKTNVEFRTMVNPQNNREWRVLLRVHLENADNIITPYVGTIECIGAFSVAPTWPEEKLEHLVAINGTGLLYASIREMVCNITSRGPWGTVMLPTQSFIAAYEASKAQQKHTETATT